MFINHYGSTEVYTYSVHFDQQAAPGCAGRPATNARLRLVRPEPGAGPDDEVEPGDTGEIICHLSSDEAFAGYWNRPDADTKAIRDGWYFTGDLGRCDAAGNLWIVGRIDDMIISGGENVHPLEVEDVLERAPGVREVAVVGLPDDRLGQAVTAFVVLDDRCRRGGARRPLPPTWTPTAWRRPTWPASSAPAATGSPTPCPRARPARSCAACCGSRRSSRRADRAAEGRRWP